MNIRGAILVCAAGAATMCGVAQGGVVAGWDFNNIAVLSNLWQAPVGNSHGNANNAPLVRVLGNDGNTDAGSVPQAFGGSLINVDPTATNAPSGSLPAFPNTSVAGNAYSFRYGTAPGNSGRSMFVPFDNSGITGTLLQLTMRFTSTGPSLLELFASTDGGATYGASPLWSLNSTLAPQSWQNNNTATSQRDSTFRYYEAPLSSLDGQANVVLKLKATWTNSSATGNVRIDNLAVTGVPAPGSLALLGLGGMLASRRRR